ncbi:hypothetical protein SteCoe_14549 [Stentor coeruleus]|uniref:Uncharacterized protein n=1 Tax=Stentor coeruleus TaxID=5963 RepID=A0A1R2C5P2_9CILI|nr:hypothetical protein SteCoe_14549 [Stentor coeruleus]
MSIFNEMRLEDYQNSESIYRSKSYKKSAVKVLPDSYTNVKLDTSPSYVLKHPKQQIKNDSLAIQENDSNREQMLNIIKSHEKEIGFLNQILNHFLDINELIKIKQKASYDESSSSWNLPNFVIQQRKTVFPNLQRSQIRDVVNSEMKKRKIVLKSSQSPEDNNFEYQDEENIKRIGNDKDGQGNVEYRPATSFAVRRSKTKGSRVKGDLEKIKYRY